MRGIFRILPDESEEGTGQLLENVAEDCVCSQCLLDTALARFGRK
jgi:hypothetical protein